jgi:hypothetical protein
LIESVLPIFGSDENARPVRIGSCVLALVDSNYFAFTAGHVLDSAASTVLSIATQGELMPLPSTIAIRSVKGQRGTDLDFGIIPLSASGLGKLAQNIFLCSTDIDELDLPDERTLSSFHFVIGFPASRALSKIDHTKRAILQLSFSVATSPPDSGIYEKECVSPADHILVEFDRQRMVRKGQQFTAPDPRGLSGGGIFFIDKQTELGPLIAIATEHRSNSRVMVGTRIKHFLEAARRLSAEKPDLFR